MSNCVKSYDVYGYKVSPMFLKEQLALLDVYVQAREQCVLANLNLHGLYMLHREPEMSQLHENAATYVAVDGMPIVLLCRLAGVSVTRKHRVTYVDLIWPLLNHAAEKGWRVYYVGSSQEVLVKAECKIRDRLPHLAFRAHHGYFDFSSEAVVADIVSFNPNVLVVGMGMPLQERWILRNMAAIAPACVLPGGAIMEYVAGVVKIPPRWMGNVGLEWLFRLVENPRRFWHRYMIEPWIVAWLLAARMSRKHAGRVGYRSCR